MSENQNCSMCNAAYPPEQLTAFDGEQLCTLCLATETVVCSHCGERIWNSENANAGNTPLCRTCYDEHYVTCDRCGCLLRADEACYEDDCDDEPYCRACYEHQCRNSGEAIHEYFYKPAPIFYGEGKRYFGVELEVDQAGESDYSAETVLDIANGTSEHIYCKHDGSLDDGFEIVTHPMTLEYHEKTMPWVDVLHALKGKGYLSHQAGTCGLHVHVNRDSFGATEEEQDACIARILYFFEKNWEELLKFSRRSPRQLERWAARYGYKEKPKDILEHAKKGAQGSRYVCVNLQNEATIEFRIFRGTLKWNTLLATLQLVNRVCDVALCLSDDELKAMSWTSFVSGCTEPELVQYLKERRLYVNEPIAAEEEV